MLRAGQQPLRSWNQRLQVPHLDGANVAQATTHGIAGRGLMQQQHRRQRGVVQHLRRSAVHARCRQLQRWAGLVQADDASRKAPL